MRLLFALAAPVRIIGELLWPLLLALVLVSLGLRLLGGLPGLGSLAQASHFASLEAAQRAVGRPIYFPAYFPEYLAYPPQTIRVEWEPYPSVFLAFARREGGDRVFTLLQVFSDRETIPGGLSLPQAKVREETLSRAGLPGFLQVGQDETGGRLYLAYWRTPERHL